MTTTDITPGQLVRYRETKSRWYFAVVRRAAKAGVELRFFDGSRATVPSADVDPVETLFDRRERKWSRSRAQLTALFYGREIQRLRPTRLREMKRALRRAGISSDPEEWPTGHTRIQLWRDASFVESDGDDPAVAGLLPQWLEPFVLPSGSRDPLGLQAPAERLVNDVLPGLTVFTFRAGYYGFLCWAIRTVNGFASSALPRRTSRRDVVNALERALVLCEFIYHGLDDDSCRLLGQRSKLRVLSSNRGDRYAVPESILKNQNSAGSFALFATSLVSLALLEEADELAADGLLPFRLTSLGGALANAFARHVDPKFTAFAMGERTEARDTLRSWGRNMCFSSIAHQGRYRDSHPARRAKRRNGTWQELPEVRRPVSVGEINRELTVLKRMFSLAIETGKLHHKPHFAMLREDNVRVCAASTTFADQRQLFLPAKGEQRSAAGDRSGTR